MPSWGGERCGRRRGSTRRQDDRGECSSCFSPRTCHPGVPTLMRVYTLSIRALCQHYDVSVVTCTTLLRHAPPLWRPCGDPHRTRPRTVPLHPDRCEDRRGDGRTSVTRSHPDRAPARLRVPDARVAAPGHPRDPLAPRAEEVDPAQRGRRVIT